MDTTTTDERRRATGSESTIPANGVRPSEQAGTPAGDEHESESGSRTKLYAILAGVGMIVLFVLLTIGLYALGDSDQSALERLRDIAIIYIILMCLILVVIMAAATAALVYLILQIKNQVIPMLEELTGTINRVRGTTEFMTDEAVKPVISAAGKVAQWKAMLKVVSGRGLK
jgi:hypothetical protein